MWKTIALFLVIFSASLGLLVLLDHRQFDEQLELARSVYVSKVEDLLKGISSGYFQWNHMYTLLSEEAIDDIEKQFDDLKEDFPAIIGLELAKADQSDFDLFLIGSSGLHLTAKFKVFNEDMSEEILDRVVLVEIDSQELLYSSGIRNIAISDTGEDFVCGLRFVRTKSSVSFFSALGSLLIAFTSVSVLKWSVTRTRLSLERQMRERSEDQRRALEAIVELTGELLEGEAAKLYQTLLEKAINIVPGAQFGSILVKDGERYVYVAAVGYDLQELTKISFSKSDVIAWVSEDFLVKKNDQIKHFDRHIGEEEYSLLKNVGRFEEVKCSLTVPEKVGGELRLVFNLDNSESEDAFSDEAKEIARLFASHLGIILKRVDLEKEINEQKRELEYLSHHDALTDLANRRMFESLSDKMLSLARRESKSVCVLFIDLSRFKLVNDRYGHQTGDEILKIIGKRLSREVRSSDTAARFGGDEFVIILYDCCIHEAEDFATRIIGAIEEPIEFENRVFIVSANVGIAEYPKHGDRIDSLIRKADAAMYRGKASNTKVYKAEN
jgi:diguanylate cyclase (GGDEF)-like protein